MILNVFCYLQFFFVLKFDSLIWRFGDPQGKVNETGDKVYVKICYSLKIMWVLIGN